MTEFENLKKAASTLGGAEGFALLKLLVSIEANGNEVALIEHMRALAEVTADELAAQV